MHAAVLPGVVHAVAHAKRFQARCSYASQSKGMGCMRLERPRGKHGRLCVRADGDNPKARELGHRRRVSVTSDCLWCASRYNHVRYTFPLYHFDCCVVTAGGCCEVPAYSCSLSLPYEQMWVPPDAFGGTTPERKAAGALRCVPRRLCKPKHGPDAELAVSLQRIARRTARR